VYFVAWQIEACWIENFASNYADGIKAEELDLAMQSLVSKVKSRKLCSPGVPASFRDFMVIKYYFALIFYLHSIFLELFDLFQSY